MKYIIRYKAGNYGPYTEEFTSTEDMIDRLNRLLMANYTIINVRMGA